MKRYLLSCVLIIAITSCAWWQKQEPKFDCTVIETVHDWPQLALLANSCASVITNIDAIPACIAAAAGNQWTQDILACFNTPTVIVKAMASAVQQGQAK